MPNTHPSHCHCQQCSQSNPHTTEETLKQETIQIEHKTFIFKLAKNHRGAFIKITEQNRTRSNSVIIPSTGINALMSILDTFANPPHDHGQQ